VKKTLTSLALVGALTLPMTSCFTMTHKVGDGGAGQSEVAERQWYILFGLVELNHVRSKELAGDAASYTVTTEWTALDVIINLFTGFVTITSREVSVSK
jgi:hypothetical protein